MANADLNQVILEKYSEMLKEHLKVCTKRYIASLLEKETENEEVLMHLFVNFPKKIDGIVEDGSAVQIKEVSYRNKHGQYVDSKFSPYHIGLIAMQLKKRLSRSSIMKYAQECLDGIYPSNMIVAINVLMDRLPKTIAEEIIKQTMEGKVVGHNSKFNYHAACLHSGSCVHFAYCKNEDIRFIDKNCFKGRTYKYSGSMDKFEHKCAHFINIRDDDHHMNVFVGFLKQRGIIYCKEQL
jgi:hypothetical protein